MILYKSGFIGHDHASLTKHFVGGDDEKRFDSNLKRMPEDWYYRNKEITYVYNDNGHRCKNIEELNFDNYVLFIGCSQTEGVGLELETTYPYLVAKELNCDYYNLALGATGVDVLEYNLLTWFYKFEKKPRYVFIQWPDHSRFVSLFPGYTHLLPNGSWCTSDEEKRFFVSGESSGFFNARKYISFNLINQIIDVPIQTINLSSLALYDSLSMSWRKIDVARDLSHFGIESHIILKNNLLKEIKND
jgi:hypothetical protein